MAKRDPGDETQPISQSQVIKSMPPKPPKKPLAKNDQSIMWRGTVVGADEFAPAQKRGGRGKWVIGGVIAAGAIGAGAYMMWPSVGKNAPAVIDAAVAKGGAAGSAVPMAADAMPAPDAAKPVDAAMPVDAAVPVDAATPDAGPGMKNPNTRKPGPKKKPPPKKKTR